MKLFYMLLRHASSITYLLNPMDMYAFFLCIFSCLITSCYALITFFILALSGMHVMCSIRHLLYYTCWTNPIILWKCFGLKLRYILFLRFLYAWFHLICIFCMSSILLGFCYYHICLVLILWYPLFTNQMP